MISLSSPHSYQVFQRAGANGAITISGTINASGTHSVEARWNGGEWATIYTGSGAFTGSLTGQAEGQGTLEVRLVGSSAVASVDYVGIGDVFGVWGQSNAVGQLTNDNQYAHATLKAAVFRNSYQWEDLTDSVDDPTDQVDTVSEDSTMGGSVWPLIATSFLADQGVPIAFVPCAKNATVISEWLPGADHEDRATLYGSGIHRLKNEVGGCRAVLWWQGESDAWDGTAEATYNAALDTLADAISADLGVPLVAAKIFDLSTWGGGVDETAVNAAIGTAWSDNANVLQGPDFSDITPSVDGVHAKTDAEGATCAGRWWTALQALFYT